MGIIENAEGGAAFDDTTDGGKDCCYMWVIIKATDQGAKSSIEAISKALNVNWDEVEVGTDTWKDQFMEALWCGGSREEQKKSSRTEFLMHVLCLPWKLLFALVPPLAFLGGWLCFFVALLMIGLVTVIIGDLAELLGC